MLSPLRSLSVKASNKQEYIGIFDSGVGGLTVLHQAQKILSKEHFLYFADSQNVPYGNKDPEEIRALINKAVSQMMTYPLKAIVIACNTATSASIKQLRADYDLPIIGMEPAIKPAVSAADSRKVLVMATELTLKEHKFKALVDTLDANDKIDSLPMQELVDYAEEYDFESSELKQYVKSKIGKMDWHDYHSVVLGCTHFLYFKSMLRQFIPEHVQLIDGHNGTLKQLQKSIVENPFGTIGDLKCMLSGTEVEKDVIMPYLNYLLNEKRSVDSVF